MASDSTKSRGVFISFEGGDGAGKTTQIRRLSRWLRDEGYRVEVSRQPGGTPIGKKIRRILLDPQHAALSDRAELLLYEADRAQHVQEVLRPALERGTIVLSDRFADSSTVYQGICRDLGFKTVIELNSFATGNLQPDLTFLLDISVEDSRRRLRKRGVFDRIEREKLAFHRRVRSGFLKLAKRFPGRIRVLDARSPEDLLVEQIRQIVTAYFRRRRIKKGR